MYRKLYEDHLNSRTKHTKLYVLKNIGPSMEIMFLAILYQKEILDKLEMSIGQGCPKFSTFVNKIFGWTDKGKSKCP